MKKARLREVEVRDVKKLLGRVINDVLTDSIEINKANCVGQLCNILLRVMTQSDLELRLSELETVFARKPDTRENVRPN